MSSDRNRFSGFVVGARTDDDGNDWPDLPESTDGPQWMRGEDWVGVFIAVDSAAAAEEFQCGEIRDEDVFSANEDAVREFFDAEASEAQEAWDEYAEGCGFDAGSGEVLFVRGTR